MNGYAQVNIGGKPRGFKWSKWAMQLYVKKSKVTTIDELQNLIDAESSTLILYCGLMANCFRKDVDADFTFEDVFDWVEEMSIEESAAFFTNLQQVIQTAQVMQEATNKKKESDSALKSGGKVKMKKEPLVLES